MTLPPLTVWPPHLSVSVYSELTDERAVFAALADVVRRHGGVGTRRVDVIPPELDFNTLTEPWPRQLDVDPAEFDRLVAGGEDAWTPVAAGFVTTAAGPLVLTYLRRHGDDRHPVEARVYADDLGLPDFVRDAEQDASAERLATWIRGLFRDACERIDPLYAELTIETTLPTPSALDGAQVDNVYVADRLLAADVQLEHDLRMTYDTGDVARWRTGLYCSTWAPFNDAGRTYAYDEGPGRQTALLLARAWGWLSSESR
jgi:hypothetical protein